MIAEPRFEIIGSRKLRRLLIRTVDMHNLVGPVTGFATVDEARTYLSELDGSRCSDNTAAREVAS